MYLFRHRQTFAARVCARSFLAMHLLLATYPVSGSAQEVGSLTEGAAQAPAGNAALQSKANILIGDVGTHESPSLTVERAATSTCDPPAQRVELEHNLLCVRGLHSSTLRVIEDDPLPGRVVQWNASYVLRQQDELSAAWPTGVNYIRISQGSLRGPRVPLVPSELPDMLEERQGFFTYHYPQTLRFRDERLFIECSPTLLPAARGIDVENCFVLVSMPNGLRLTVQAYAGAFYDGGPGWPTLLRDYDPATWQAALDQVAAFLDLVLVFQERT